METICKYSDTLDNSNGLSDLNKSDEENDPKEDLIHE